jgi:hypothetical protein
MFAAIGLALVILVLAIVLQTAYHKGDLALELARLALAVCGEGTCTHRRCRRRCVRAWLDPVPPQNDEREDRLTFDGLTLISKVA